MTLSNRSQFLSSKEGTNMIESLRVMQETQKHMTNSYKMPTDIS